MLYNSIAIKIKYNDIAGCSLFRDLVFTPFEYWMWIFKLVDSRGHVDTRVVMLTRVVMFDRFGKPQILFKTIKTIFQLSRMFVGQWPYNFTTFFLKNIFYKYLLIHYIIDR